MRHDKTRYKDPPKPDQWFWAEVVHEEEGILGTEIVRISGKPMLSKKQTGVLAKVFDRMRGLESKPGYKRVMCHDAKYIRIMIAEDRDEASRVATNLAAESEYAEIREYRECGVLVTNADIDVLMDAVHWGRSGLEGATVRLPFNLNQTH